MSTVASGLLDALAKLLRETQDECAALRSRVEALEASQLRSVTIEPGSGSDPRAHVLLMELADGSMHARHVRIAVPVHRGKWDADATYSANDEVAWDGHSWRCRRADLRGSEPGKSDAWLMVARRGSKGANAKPVEADDSDRPAEPDARTPRLLRAVAQ